MADSVVGKITENLVAALNAKAITFNNKQQTITAEEQRAVMVIGDRYPYVHVCGPVVNVVDRAHQTCHVRLEYVIELYTCLNDEYISGENNLPITKVCADIHADLMKLIMASNSRGGLALKTNCDDFGHYFSGDVSSPDFVVWVHVVVETNIRENDPYYGG